MNAQGQMDFVSIGESVLAYLQQHYPLDLWTISRVNQNDFIVLQFSNDHPQLKLGNTFKLEDTIFWRLPSTPETKIVQDIDKVAYYREAPISISFNIKGGICTPIYVNGTLFGSLCGMHSTPLKARYTKSGPDIDAQVAKLISALEHDFAMIEELRKQEQSAAAEHMDALTQVPDWRGWDILLDAEQLRCKTYGNKGIIINVDIADLKVINQTHSRETGDTVLKQTANTLKSLVRAHDIVARVGNDEFAVVCIDHPTLNASTLSAQIKTALKQQHIDCYVGYATSLPQKGLREAWEMAEHMMYKEKKLSKYKN
jgi:diguanylate cyclase